MNLSEVLNRKGRSVVQAGDAVTVREAAKEMCRHHVGSIALIDLEENLVGILTERDILRYFAEQDAPRPDQPVAEVMTREPFTAPPETLVEDAVGIMTERRFRRLPVTGKDGKLIGIVTMGDLARAMLDEKAREAETLRDYIAS